MRADGHDATLQCWDEVRGVSVRGVDDVPSGIGPLGCMDQEWDFGVWGDGGNGGVGEDGQPTGVSLEEVRPEGHDEAVRVEGTGLV